MHAEFAGLFEGQVAPWVAADIRSSARMNIEVIFQIRRKGELSVADRTCVVLDGFMGGHVSF